MSSKAANIFFSREAIAPCGSECLSALLLYMFKNSFLKIVQLPLFFSNGDFMMRTITADGTISAITSALTSQIEIHQDYSLLACPLQKCQEDSCLTFWNYVINLPKFSITVADILITDKHDAGSQRKTEKCKMVREG